MTWVCHICGRERPDELISVLTHDRSAELGWPAGTWKENVRYCNDNPDCRIGAESFRFLKLETAEHAKYANGAKA